MVCVSHTFSCMKLLLLTRICVLFVNLIILGLVTQHTRILLPRWMPENVNHRPKISLRLDTCFQTKQLFSCHLDYTKYSNNQYMILGKPKCHYFFLKMIPCYLNLEMKQLIHLLKFQFSSLVLHLQPEFFGVSKNSLELFGLPTCDPKLKLLYFKVVCCDH